VRTCSFCRLAVPRDAIVCRVCQTVIGQHSGAAEAVA
jgi:RNA polymerase subunit RPABC4/transcription elongation factor Spt4